MSDSKSKVAENAIGHLRTTVPRLMAEKLKISFITLGPAGAGGRPAGGGRPARIGGSRDEPGLQCSLHLCGLDAGDLQGSFKVSPDCGTDELERKMRALF